MNEITSDELRSICDAVVRLTEIRQCGCSHLSVENFAPELMRKLLLELQMHKMGMIRAEDVMPANTNLSRERSESFRI